MYNKLQQTLQRLYSHTKHTKDTTLIIYRHNSYLINDDITLARDEEIETLALVDLLIQLLRTRH